MYTKEAVSLLVCHSEFFSPCSQAENPEHQRHSSRDISRNWFDLSTGESCCSVCIQSSGQGHQNAIQGPLLKNLLRYAIYLVSLLRYAPQSTPSHGTHPRLPTAHTTTRTSPTRNRRPTPHSSLSRRHETPEPPNAVRRSSYHDVVKIADMQKICSVQHVQSYVINGSKVFFLKRRPQPRPPKGAVGTCRVGPRMPPASSRSLAL